VQLYDLLTKSLKDLEALVQSEDWTSGSVLGGKSPCKWTVELLCSGSGAAAKADACNQGGSICRWFSGEECTDDASCKKKPCCKSWARRTKAALESLCTGVSEKALKEIDDDVSPCLGL